MLSQPSCLTKKNQHSNNRLCGAIKGLRAHLIVLLFRILLNLCAYHCTRMATNAMLMTATAETTRNVYKVRSLTSVSTPASDDV